MQEPQLYDEIQTSLESLPFQGSNHGRPSIRILYLLILERLHRDQQSWKAPPLQQAHQDQNCRISSPKQPVLDKVAPIGSFSWIIVQPGHQHPHLLQSHNRQLLQACLDQPNCHPIGLPFPQCQSPSDHHWSSALVDVETLGWCYTPPLS